jgi:putative hydrolase of the HAD superfamily
MYIFFDVDGVLINGFHSNQEFQKRWDNDLEKDFGLKSEDLTTHFFYGPFLDVLIGKRDLYDALDDALSQIAPHVKTDDLISYWFINDSVLYEETIDLVKQLAAHPKLHLYIATNQEHHRAKYLWENLKFKTYFKDIYYSARLGCMKNNPLYFQKINDDLKLNCQSVLFFDDSPDNMSPAQQVGWDAVLMNTPQDIRSHKKLLPYLR